MGKVERLNRTLHAARRTLHTGSDLLTDKQRQRLTALCADDEHVEVEATWGIHQHMIAAYRGSALGYRNLTNYIARYLLETGGLRPRHGMSGPESFNSRHSRW